ncbi:MAG: PAS domain S-box protein [Anaerolineales bacterium]|nr:PAS domain S-box protein [Anaerolineales bacterium]
MNTKFKQIEADLLQSEETARALLNAIPGNALLIDIQGIILNINERAALAVGYSPDEVISKRSYDLLPPSVVKSRKAYARKVVRTGRSIEFEDTLDGKAIYNRLCPVLDQNGQVTRIAVFGQDITERKQMEMALQKSKDYLNTLMDSVADPIFTVKMPARKIEFVNQAVYDLFGYRPEELIGQNTRLFYPDEGAFNFFDQALKNALDNGQSQVRQEQVLLRKNGEPLWTEINTAFMFSNAQLSQVISVVRDITKRKRAEEAIRRYTGQLEAMREISEDLMTQLELETLLHSIASYAVELLSGNGGGLYLYRPERDVLEWSVAVHPDAAPIGTILQRGEGLSGKVLEKDAPLIVEDYKHWEGRTASFEDYPRTAIVAAPVRWGKEFLGVLNVLSDSPGAFSSDDAELLSLFASQAGIAIENARLYDSERKQRDELERINKLIFALAQVSHPCSSCN